MATQTDAESVAEEIEQRLNSKFYVERWLTLAEIEKHGPWDVEIVPLMLDRIDSETGRLRQLAIRVLGNIGPEAHEAVSKLTTLADGGDRDAIWALGRIGPRASQSISVLEKCLVRKPFVARLYAAAALWRIEQSREAISVIQEAVDKQPKGCSRYTVEAVVAELDTAGRHLLK